MLNLLDLIFSFPAPILLGALTERTESRLVQENSANATIPAALHLVNHYRRARVSDVRYQRRQGEQLP